MNIPVILGILFLAVVLIIWIWGFETVPEGKNAVVEQLGRFDRIMKPGVNFKIPYIERIAATVSMKDQIIDIPPQDTITLDNAEIKIDAIAVIRVKDPKKAVYEITNFKDAISLLLQTAIREDIAGLDLDKALGFSARVSIQENMVEKLRRKAFDWGIEVKAVEIKDIKPSDNMLKAMEQQAAAERHRRAVNAEAKGRREELILKADGERVAHHYRADAKLDAAKMNAERDRIESAVTEETMRKLAEVAGSGDMAARFLLGEQYIQAMKKLAESPNAKIVVLPPDIVKAVEILLSRK